MPPPTTSATVGGCTRVLRSLAVDTNGIVLSNSVYRPPAPDASPEARKRDVSGVQPGDQVIGVQGKPVGKGENSPSDDVELRLRELHHASGLRAEGLRVAVTFRTLQDGRHVFYTVEDMGYAPQGRRCNQPAAVPGPSAPQALPPLGVTTAPAAAAASSSSSSSSSPATKRGHEEVSGGGGGGSVERAKRARPDSAEQRRAAAAAAAAPPAAAAAAAPVGEPTPEMRPGAVAQLFCALAPPSDPTRIGPYTDADLRRYSPVAADTADVIVISHTLPPALEAKKRQQQARNQRQQQQQVSSAAAPETANNNHTARQSAAPVAVAAAPATATTPPVSSPPPRQSTPILAAPILSEPPTATTPQSATLVSRPTPAQATTPSPSPQQQPKQQQPQQQQQQQQQQPKQQPQQQQQQQQPEAKPLPQPHEMQEQMQQQTLVAEKDKDTNAMLFVHTNGIFGPAWLSAGSKGVETL